MVNVKTAGVSSTFESHVVADVFSSLHEATNLVASQFLLLRSGGGREPAMDGTRGLLLITHKFKNSGSPLPQKAKQVELALLFGGEGLGVRGLPRAVLMFVGTVWQLRNHLDALCSTTRVENPSPPTPLPKQVWGEGSQNSLTCG